MQAELLNNFFTIDMKKNYVKLLVVTLLFAAFVFTIASCNSGTNPPITPLKSGEIQATVTPFGQFFASDTHVTEGPTTYFIAASIKDKNNIDSVVLHILVPKQTTLPYSIDVASDPVAVLDYCITTNNGCITYRAKQNVGSGTVRITDVSPNVKGSFSGTLPAETGSGSAAISSGDFNASF